MLTPALCLAAIWLAQADQPVDLGDRLELMVDDAVAATMSGGAARRLHQPVRREIVFRTDQPWEGNASGYQSLVHDGDVYRLYYRGLHYRHGGAQNETLDQHPAFLCVAESRDGLVWTRPRVGRIEFGGSRDNNIVLAPEDLASIGGDPAHSMVWLDEHPDCPAEARYKGIIVGSKPTGMYVLRSADGLRFEVLTPDPIQTVGAFDSQNLAFWDPVAKVYREYHRGFKDGVRGILTASSPDLRHFPEPVWLTYDEVPEEHLYTNQIQPYPRAPHILIGFPLRYTDRGWSPGLLDLPNSAARIARGLASPRYGSAVTDAVFMASRDGLRFRRWGEAFIRPGPQTTRSWVYGDNFVVRGMIPTASAVEDEPDELSLYATDGYWEGSATALRRYTLRTDGFVSINAPLSGGEVLTRPLVFRGGALALNIATSGAGGVQVELQDVDGEPIDGFRLADCPLARGDALALRVRWTNGGDLSALAGRPVRLRIRLSDADLYALQFVPYEPAPDLPAQLTR